VLFLRIVLPLVGLWLLGLAAAWLITRERKYLVLAYRSVMVIGLLLVVLGLLYVFERLVLL
jgi:hypothetical protein